MTAPAGAVSSTTAADDAAGEVGVGAQDQAAEAEHAPLQAAAQVQPQAVHAGGRHRAKREPGDDRRRVVGHDRGSCQAPGHGPQDPADAVHEPPAAGEFVGEEVDGQEQQGHEGKRRWCPRRRRRG